MLSFKADFCALKFKFIVYVRMCEPNRHTTHSANTIFSPSFSSPSLPDLDHPSYLQIPKLPQQPSLSLMHFSAELRATAAALVIMPATGFLQQTAMQPSTFYNAQSKDARCAQSCCLQVHVGSVGSAIPIE